jgi:hypothetical protein
VHPIERLRFVARSQGAPADLLVEESAAALVAFRDDPAGLVAACRRIIDRQLACGPLWWLCARLLCAPDPMEEARAAVRELGGDATPRLLAAALPDAATAVVVGRPDQSIEALARRGDVSVLAVDTDGDAPATVHRLLRADVDVTEVPARAVGVAVADASVLLVDALAVGPSEALVPTGSRAAAATAVHAGVPVWLVAGVGRLLPERMWEALAGRWGASVEPLDAAEELLPLDLVTSLCGPDGVVDVAQGLRRCDCPVAPELFRLAG